MNLTEMLLTIIGIYCFLMMLDCFLVGRKLKSLINEDKSRKASVKFPFCYTLAGRMLMKLAENTQYKLAVLNWQSENNLQNSLSSQVIDNESQKSGSFYHGLINAIFSKLRVETIFIITTILNENSQLEVQQAHSRNGRAIPPKLTRYLVNFYHSYFRQNDEGLLGLRDGFQSKSLTGEFYLFGYRYVMALPINYSNHEGKKIRGLLWLGYNKNTEPYAHEINIAREVCGKIEKEFASQRMIEELSSKVKEEKVINKQRDEFLAHVSHDIRSPLNNIRSIVNLLRLESRDKEILELLDTALGNCHDVEEIINSILDYTRFQAGQLTNKKEVFDINFLAEEIISNQKVEARLKNLALSLNYDPSLHIMLEADRKQIKRIINNLVSNAVKYTRQGTIEVTIVESSTGICSIQVRDSGVGMSGEQLGLLFTPFYRFHKKEAEGIGLGLALSKILTELNGGQIKARSAVGRGSIFEITFPYHKKIEKLPSQVSNEFKGTKMTSVEVMVLDDNAAAVESLSKMLLKMGFNVTKCFTVSDAMSIMNFSPPDFLITDWHMPDGGARRLLNYLKLIQSQARVCVLSGSSDENTLNEIRSLGVDNVFCKSEDFEKLQAWLNDIQQLPALKQAAG